MEHTGPDFRRNAVPTNVTKLALAVAGEFDGVPQRLYYHRGVGSYGRARLRGGAFGVGVAHDVLRAYRFVVDNYEPDDEIFLFGFSRGAYTARSVAGLIRNAGVLKPAAVERLDDAYALYRARSIKPRDIESELFRRSYSHEDTRIRFIGVWDTVGALGIPTIGPKFLMDRINRRFAFHDTELSSRVDVAMHAVAIDERRKAFRPALWTRHDDAGDQVVEQVWFSGVHSDVGGGYPDSSLADVALRWLAGRAAEHGLGLRNGAFTTEAGWGVENLPAVHANPSARSTSHARDLPPAAASGAASPRPPRSRRHVRRVERGPAARRRRRVLPAGVRRTRQGSPRDRRRLISRRRRRGRPRTPWAPARPTG